MLVDDDEEIQHISFLDDEEPSTIMMLTYDYTRGCTVSRILHIKQEKGFKFDRQKKEFERKLRLVGMVEDGI